MHLRVQIHYSKLEQLNPKVQMWLLNMSLHHPTSTASIFRREGSMTTWLRGFVGVQSLQQQLGGTHSHRPEGVG